MGKRLLEVLVVISIISSSFSFAETKLNLKAKSAYLIEASTGEVLYASNEHEQLRPASVTKVMTLLLIMEALDSGTIKIEDRVPCSLRARNMGGSQIWLDPREELTVHEMLKAICVVSANDCCVAMSEYIAGSEEIFVERMNERAKELGMNDTVFKNCHGIDEDGHVMSAYDIALVSRELIKHEKIFEYTSIWMDTLRDGKSSLVNTNKLIHFYQGANGLKTGSTSLALYSLSASAKRNDMQLIGVVMACPTSKERQADATKLLDFGFANYSIERMDKKGDIAGIAKVSRGEKDSVNGIIKDSFAKLMKKGDIKNIGREVIFNEIKAPVELGDKIGEIIYKQNDSGIGKVDIVADESIEKVTFGKILAKIMIKWVKVGR